MFDESLLEADAAVIDTGTDAGPDAGHDASDVPRDAGPACPLVKPPARPAVDDGASMGEVVFALRDFDLDQGEEWSTIGYDLDDLCSMPPAPEVECFPPAASGVPELDGPGGLDNAFGHQVAPLILTARPDLAEHIYNQHVNGGGNLLVAIREWNGEADDPRVDVVVSQAAFGAPALDDGGMPDVTIPDGGFDPVSAPTPLPAWDGRDWFWVRAEAYLDGDPSRPLLRDDNAYVAGNSLVVRLGDRVPLVFASATAERGVIVRLTDAVLVLEISEDRATVSRATLAGRWPIVDMLGDIEHSEVCPGTDDYRTFGRLLDLAADVRAAPGTGGGTARCDAVSVGIGYTGMRAHVAEVTDRFGFPTPCTDAGVPDDGG